MTLWLLLPDGPANLHNATGHLRCSVLVLSVLEPPQDMLCFVATDAKVEAVHGGEPLLPHVGALEVRHNGVPNKHHVRLHFPRLVHKAVVLGKTPPEGLCHYEGKCPVRTNHQRRRLAPHLARHALPQEHPGHGTPPQGKAHHVGQQGHHGHQVQAVGGETRGGSVYLLASSRAAPPASLAQKKVARTSRDVSNPYVDHSRQSRLLHVPMQ
ncbi:hypothetical protein E2C01_019843 [Portunus trituberculatus]|uniref:Uncharacterized protein n=1 Tax=Portunus trituberculatus TaxID=210409 RepID=A0A5B7E044_PORTR|nr:hypothetical protein [Portunus trituberculatus]